MNVISYIKRAASAGSLARGRKVMLGRKLYGIKGFFTNALAQNSPGWGEQEPWLSAVYRSVLQCRAGAFLDVGANLGQTMFKVLALDPSRQYIGFEPQVACCFMIQRFLDENHITNFTILPIGLSNTNQLMKIHGGQSDYASIASVVEGFRPDSFYTSDRYVCLRMGDEVIGELDVESICCIKVDVEGAELEVFEGLLNTVEKNTPFLIFEVLNHFLAVTGKKLDDQTLRFRELRIEKMEEVLRKRGFEIFNIIPGNQLTNIRKITPPASDDLSRTNYIAVPKSGVDELLRVFASQAGVVQSDSRVD